MSRYRYVVSTCFIYFYNCKVFLVVGGWSGSWPAGSPSTTEILVEGASAWQSIQSTIYGSFEYRTISFNNQILLFGNFFHI